MHSQSGAPVSQKYCQYAQSICDQTYVDSGHIERFFIYGSTPPNIAQTIRNTIAVSARQPDWLSWEDLPIAGHIIFCKICQAIRKADLVVADISTLNFNVLFEMGYCIGLGKAVLPIRDATYNRHSKQLRELGFLETLGHVPFQNSTKLNGIVSEAPISTGIFPSSREYIDHDRPIYLVKSHIDDDGSIKLLSRLKKSPFRFRTFDPREMPILSLDDIVREVHRSAGIIAHLVDENRHGAEIHNARCAFIAGMGMASGKRVLMVQENPIDLPIDYRDIIFPYINPEAIVPVLAQFIDGIQSVTDDTIQLRTKSRDKLEDLDIGDLAAENEMHKLAEYFVPTAQYNQAKRGQARLVSAEKDQERRLFSIKYVRMPEHMHLTLYSISNPKAINLPSSEKPF